MTSEGVAKKVDINIDGRLGNIGNTAVLSKEEEKEFYSSMDY